MKPLRLVLVAALLGTLTPAQAGFFVAPGEAGLSTLKVPVAANAQALAGAYVASTGDVSSIEYNPAGLATIQRFDIYLTHLAYLEDAKLQTAQFGYPLDLNQIKKGQANSENKLVVGVQYRSFRAEDENRNSLGVKIGDFDVKDQLLGGVLAYQFGALSVGGGVKYLKSQLADESLANTAFDAGALYDASPNLRFGVSAMHIGPSKAYVFEKDPLPTTLRAGAVYNAKQVRILTDFSQTRDKIFRSAAGLEWAIGNVVKLRGGAAFHDEIELSAGMGLFFDLGPLKPVPVNTRTPKAVETKSAANDEINTRRGSVLSKTVRRLADELDNKYQTSTLGNRKVRVAILPLNSEIKNLGNAVSDLLTYEFSMKDRYTVIERSQLSQILAEQKLQQSGAINLENAAQVGQLAAADLVVLGSADPLEPNILINTRMVHVNEGNIIATAIDEIPEDSLRTPSKPNLSEVANRAPANTERMYSRNNEEASVDVGLDYAFTNRHDLGTTHTVSFKILY